MTTNESGVIISGQTYGEELAADQIAYLKSDGKWWKAKADAEATSAGEIGLVLDAGPSGRILKLGYRENSAWTWTPGSPVYLSAATAGGLTQTRPSGAGTVVRIVGYPASATTLWVDPAAPQALATVEGLAADAGDIIVGDDGAWTKVAAGDAGKILASNGAGSLPTWDRVARTATYVVAASNAPAHVKRQADYVCDGTADEVQIRAAIVALGVVGGRVLLTEGNFHLTAADIQMESKTTLSGQGAATVVHLDAYRINILADRTQITIENLTIDATNLGARNGMPITAGSSSIVYRDLTIKNQPDVTAFLPTIDCTDITFDGLVFENVSTPIQITRASDARVINCRATGDGTLPFIKMYSCERVIIQGNTSRGKPLLTGEASTSLSTHGVIVSNNVVEGYHDNYAIILNRSTGVVFERAIVTGNIVVAAATTVPYNAIAIYGVDDFLVANNTADQTLSGHNAIGISNAKRGVVVGNVVRGCNEAGEGGIEIEANPVHAGGPSHSEQILVTGNQVYDCTYGIYTRTMLPDHTAWAGAPQVPNDVQISDNYVYDTDIGIALITGDKIVAKNNYLDTNTANMSVDPAVTNATVVGNAGHVTENRGAATSTADGGTIAHGCAAAPTTVTVSGSVAGEIVTVTSIDATNITVAIKAAGGSTPGTSQTVYWRAEV